MRQPPFTIIHPTHGKATCDEHQFAEFAGLGWKRESDVDALAQAEAEAKAKAEAEAKAKAEAEFRAADKNGDGKLSAAEKKAAEKADKK